LQQAREICYRQKRGPRTEASGQFWRVLWSCENDPRERRFDLTRKATPGFDARIAKKVQLLKGLRKRGIWLIDASVIGIDGQAPKVKREVTSVCWEKHVGPRILMLKPRPRRIIVIGVAVAEAIFGSRSRVGTWSGIPYEVVNQPQGDRSKEGTRKTLARIHELASECK